MTSEADSATSRLIMKILTTHVGSLPGPEGFASTGEHDEGTLRRAVEWVVGRQREVGLDIINEGECTKGGDWLSFTDDRFGGFTAGQRKGPPIVTLGKDREEFADFYQWASERGTIFFEPGDQIKKVRKHWICTGPITYTGQAVLQREIDLLKAAAGSGADLRTDSTHAAARCVLHNAHVDAQNLSARFGAQDVGIGDVKVVARDGDIQIVLEGKSDRVVQ